MRKVESHRTGISLSSSSSGTFGSKSPDVFPCLINIWNAIWHRFELRRWVIWCCTFASGFSAFWCSKKCVIYERTCWTEILTMCTKHLDEVYHTTSDAANNNRTTQTNLICLSTGLKLSSPRGVSFFIHLMNLSLLLALSSVNHPTLQLEWEWFEKSRNKRPNIFSNIGSLQSWEGSLCDIWAHMVVWNMWECNEGRR